MYRERVNTDFWLAGGGVLPKRNYSRMRGK